VTVIMHDSTDAKDIPLSAVKVAGYDNGDYEWSVDDWALFPKAVKVGICVYVPGKDTPPISHALDIEEQYVEHDAKETRYAASRWVNDRIAAGAHPTIYTSLSVLWNFRGLFCSFWVADYTGSEHMLSVPGYDIVATQYASPSTGSGGHYDLSVTADNWPIQGAPNMPNAGKMLHFERSQSGNGYWIVTVDGVYAYGDVADVNGHPVPMLTQDTFKAFVPTASGRGYWLVDTDANVYSYGDAQFYGHP